MPGSAVSYGSGSQASSGSRRARTRRYHKVAHTSQVDESLFGTPHREQKRQELLEDRWRHGESDITRQAAERSAKRRSGGSAKETVQVITKDLIRNLIVPQEDPSGQSLIMSGSEYNRIIAAARVLTDEERNAALEAYKRHKAERIDMVEERKNFMKMKDLERRKNEKLNELEVEEQKKSEHLRQKAVEQLQEQEDEIKHLNELILNAKCHAIRDAQILEKDQVKKEMATEEQRLDQMMEIDRQNVIRMEEDIEKKRKQERLLGCYKIMEQIQENEQERLLELERKDQENRMMQKYLDKLCEEEAEKLDKKRQEQNKLREDLNQCNDEILRRKELATEQEKLAEFKVLEYQKQKADREQAYEKEQERIRIKKKKVPTATLR